MNIYISGAEAEKVGLQEEDSGSWGVRVYICAYIHMYTHTFITGTGAEEWGLWEEDPGPRGVRLANYPKLDKNKGKSPVTLLLD